MAHSGSNVFMKTICLCLVLLATTANAGRPSVIDGDTLEIHGTRIRLFGIDAPESSQLCRGDDSLPYRCGAKAANELDSFIAGRPVSCELPAMLAKYPWIKNIKVAGGCPVLDVYGRSHYDDSFISAMFMRDELDRVVWDKVRPEDLFSRDIIWSFRVGD